MEQPPQPEDTVQCELCGREFQAEDMEYCSRLAGYLCPDCQEEEQSCGCADE